ncbi:MAG: TlpA disulfide reductase family protein [Pseudomonadota bacterium]
MPKQQLSQVNRREVIQSTTLAGLALAAPAWAKDRGPALPKMGSVMKLPDAKLLDGSNWRPASVDGKTLVVYWWASWCPFCAVQSPHIERLWRSQREQGLSVLALSVDTKLAAAATYMKAKNYSFPAGMLTPQVARTLPKPAGLPVVVVLKVEGREGKVVFAEAGEMFPEDIEGLKKYI